MTFQEILEGITRHRANAIAQQSVVMDPKTGMGSVAAISDVELLRKISEIEWALHALAEALNEREKELSAVAPHDRAGHASDAVDEVDEAFAEYEKRE